MSSEGLIRREYACMFRQSCGKRTCLEGWEGSLILELVACFQDEGCVVERPCKLSQVDKKLSKFKLSLSIRSFNYLN